MLVKLIVFVFSFGYAYSHTYHLGECPKVEPMQNFDIEPFLGKWYVIQKTSTASSCLVNNYTNDAEHHGQYKIEQISEHFLLGLTSVDHKYHYTGDLTIPNANIPARMQVKFPLNVVGGASYTVLLTDYNTYAGVFTCQKLAFAHRQSATILSRKPTLDRMYLDKVMNRLSAFGIDPFSLSVISQTNCTQPSDDTANININSGTFSTDRVAGVLRTAGSKIEDGFETISDSAKNLYNKARDSYDSSEKKANVNNPKNDVEWLP